MPSQLVAMPSSSSALAPSTASSECLKPVNQVQISYSTFGTKLKLKFTLAAPEFDSPEDDAFTSGTMNFQTRTQSKTFALHTFSSHLAHWINLFFTSTSFSFARLPSDFSEQEVKESHLKMKLNFQSWYCHLKSKNYIEKHLRSPPLHCTALEPRGPCT